MLSTTSGELIVKASKGHVLSPTLIMYLVELGYVIDSMEFQ